MPDSYPLSREIDKVEKRSFLAAVYLYGEQVKRWANELDRLKGFGDYANLSPIEPPAGKLFQKTMALAYVLGWHTMTQDIKAREARRKLDDTMADVIINGLDDALRELKNKRVIPAEEFRAAAAYGKASKFSVQKVERLSALKAIKQSIIDAMVQGMDFGVWKAGIMETFTAHGVTPLSPHHIENVWRTNIHSVYNIGRFQGSYTNPLVEGYEYIAVLDSRVSDICESLAGARYRKNNPVWATIWPPNHYMCRSTTMPITMGWAKTQKIRYKKKVAPGDLAGVHAHFRKPALNLKAMEKRLGQRLAQLRVEVAALDKVIKGQH